MRLNKQGRELLRHQTRLYNVDDVIRALRKDLHDLDDVVTDGGEQFVCEAGMGDLAAQILHRYGCQRYIVDLYQGMRDEGLLSEKGEREADRLYNDYWGKED